MFNRRIQLLTSKPVDLEATKKASTYFGRKVFSNIGSNMGHVKEVILKDNNVIGFIVKGKRTLYIDRAYVSLESDKALVLTIYPVTELIGKQVFDAEGRKIGVVIDIERNSDTNSFTNLVVREKIYRKPINIPKSEIGAFKKNIILNKKHEPK